MEPLLNSLLVSVPSICTLHGTRPYPVKREVRKIIGSTIQDGICDRSQEGIRTCILHIHPGKLTAGTYSHHPFRKENDLHEPNLQGIMFQPWIFRGVSFDIQSFKIIYRESKATTSELGQEKHRVDVNGFSAKFWMGNSGETDRNLTPIFFWGELRVI